MNRLGFALAVAACCLTFYTLQTSAVQPAADDDLGSPQLVPVIWESHRIEKRQAQGSASGYYANSFPHRQPYSIGGQRFFLPLPPWGWNGPGGAQKPGSCYRPGSQPSFGGGQGGNNGVRGGSGGSGGNRPTTPPPRPRPCRMDSQCNGNKKCCSGTCTTPSFVG